MLQSTTAILNDITSGVRSTDSTLKLQAKSEFAVRYACMQSWYLRSSSQSKIDILTEMLHCLENLDSLQLILKTLNSCTTKSLVYGKGHRTTNFVFDKPLRDDDRALDPDTFEKTKQSEVSWFQKLDDSQQVLILIGLIRLGGGSVMHKIYHRGIALYMSKVQQTSPVVTKVPDTDKTEGIISLDILERKDSDLIPPRMYSVIPARMPTLDPRDPYVLAVEKARKEWDVMINKYRIEVDGKPAAAESSKKKGKGTKSPRSDKSSKKSKKGKKGKEEKGGNEELDRVQLLPIWIVKRIFSYLDAGTLKRAKQVNQYWAYAIADMQRDIKARKSLNKTISKMQAGLEDLHHQKASSHIQRPSSPKRRVQKLIERGSTLPKLRDFPDVGPLDTKGVTSLAVEQDDYDYILPLSQLEYFPRNILKSSVLYKVPSCVVNELGFLKLDDGTISNKDDLSKLSERFSR